MDIPTIRPPRLNVGDTIAIVAPASPLESPEALESGIVTLEKMGFRVQFKDRIFQSFRYLAGDDASRAEELMQAFENPEIRGIVALRGGYGCARLIPLLTEKRFRPWPKLFMGFSDLTTLHLFFRRRFGWITIHGPMATTIGSITDEERRHILSLWTDNDYRPCFSFTQLETWVPGVAEGILTGGCLSLIAASIGTPYEIRTEGKILFLEDHSEPSYRLDRMLTHLHLAGKFQSITGLLLGRFNGCDVSQGDYTVQETLQEILSKYNVPILANFPAGHGAGNWAIPLGVRVRLNAGLRTIEFLEAAVC